MTHVPVSQITNKEQNYHIVFLIHFCKCSRVFLNVKVRRKCIFDIFFAQICLQTTAATYNITAMPTFLFLKNGKKVDEIKGADPQKLEDKIKKWYSVESEGGGSSGVHGYVSLEHY